MLRTPPTTPRERQSVEAASRALVVAKRKGRAAAEVEKSTARVAAPLATACAAVPIVPTAAAAVTAPSVTAPKANTLANEA